MSHVVVVEDEHTAALEIQMSLEEAGHSVPKVFSSGEGLISAFERGDWMHPPDVLLIDLTPAGTLNGVETASRLKSLTNTPIVYLVSEQDDVLRSAAERTKPHGYISKPIDRHLLCDTVQAIISQQHDTSSQVADFSTLGDGLILSDKRGRITFINQVAERLLGTTDSMARGQTLNDIYVLRLHDRNRRADLPIAKVLEQGQSISSDSYLLVDGNGYELRIQQRMAPLRSASNDIIGMSVSFQVMQREQTPQEGMRGRIEDFEDTLAIMESFSTMAQQGMMTFKSRGNSYRFYLEQGQVVHIEHQQTSYRKALQQVANLHQGEFLFLPNVTIEHRSLNLNPMRMLLEFVKQQDERTEQTHAFIRRNNKALLVLHGMEQALHYVEEIGDSAAVYAWLEPLSKDNPADTMLVIEDERRALLVPNGDISALPEHVQRAQGMSQL